MATHILTAGGTRQFYDEDRAATFRELDALVILSGLPVPDPEHFAQPYADDTIDALLPSLCARVRRMAVLAASELTPADIRREAKRAVHMVTDYANQMHKAGLLSHTWLADLTYLPIHHHGTNDYAATCIMDSYNSVAEEVEPLAAQPGIHLPATCEGKAATRIRQPA